ncbi:hypothetical protein PTKIN_Ptkin14bG0201100 [Pterospermum kingtungense]
MKVSFSLPSKSKSTRKPPIATASAAHEQVQNSKVSITEFDASKLLTDPNFKPSFVIPRLEPGCPPYKKMKNLESEPPCRYILSDPSSRYVQFELDSPSRLPHHDFEISEGLNIRSSSSSSNNNDSINGVAAEVEQGIIRESTAPAGPVLLRCLQEDLKRLPEDPGFEEFEDKPVEGFGEALLARNGWVEGRGIGRKAKEEVKVKDYPRRTYREGLGYLSKESKEKLRLEEDLNRLRKDRYEGLVEGFGKTRLSVYEWFEWRGIGKNANEEEKCSTKLKVLKIGGGPRKVIKRSGGSKKQVKRKLMLRELGEIVIEVFLGLEAILELGLLVKVWKGEGCI